MDRGASHAALLFPTALSVQPKSKRAPGAVRRLPSAPASLLRSTLHPYRGRRRYRPPLRQDSPLQRQRTPQRQRWSHQAPLLIAIPTVCRQSLPPALRRGTRRRQQPRPARHRPLASCSPGYSEPRAAACFSSAFSAALFNTVSDARSQPIRASAPSTRAKRSLCLA